VEAISAQLDTIAALASTLNTQGYLALFTDDAVLMPPAGPALIGKDQALSYYQKLFSPFLPPEVKYTLDAIEVSGALAVRRYRGLNMFTLKSTGRKVLGAIKYVDVLRKQPDGSWKIALHMWASNSPRPLTR
jgi:uncharacterized protein (TIGR02246 family)